MHCLSTARQCLPKLMKSCSASILFVARLAIVTMSSPARIFSWRRNDSLITRLIRFRSTALDATRRDTVTPSRLNCRPLSRAYTTNRSSLLPQACAITNWYSVEETSRRLFENRKPGAPAADTDTLSLGAQAGAATGAASINYRAPAAGPHSGPKSMSALALNFTWLESSFHY